MTIPLPTCVHRGAEVSSGNFVCRTDRLVHSGVVSERVCRRCPYANKPRRKSVGLGDTVHRVTHALGLDKLVQAVTGDCQCSRRLEWLNDAVPYGARSWNVDENAPSSCDDSLSDAAPIMAPVRNLMMYIYPIAQYEVWRWNIEQIRQRLHLFNGTRIVSIMTDERTNSAEEVQEAFGAERIDLWNIGLNDGFKWEMQGLPRMMRSMYSCDPNEITFYCHAKGVQGPEHVSGPTFLQQPRVKWATSMYGACLDDMPFVEQQLETHTFAGAFKRRMVHGEGPYRSSWHFAGTFYWFRNARLFALPNWHHFDHQWYGAETYPGQLVGWGQAAGLFCDHPPQLYVQEAWTGQVDGMWEAWKKEHGICTPA